MGSGKDFEDSLCDALEEWVGDNGYVWLRRQTRQMRRGKFGMDQELDILLDSSDDEYYVGLEAKSRDTESSAAGLYFSKLNPDQFLEQEEYREVSGRRVSVAVELRNCCEKGDCAFLLPLDLFLEKIREDATKVSWDEVRDIGAYMGSNGDLEITENHFGYVESLSGTGEDTIRANDEDSIESIEPPRQHESR